MSTRTTARPSPAMLVAAVALTFALIGTAVAADPVAKLNPKKVRKIANQEIDKRAAGLSVANAASATNAANLGNLPASAYAKTTIEPYHAIGTAGEPPFQNGWGNSMNGRATAAFLKDPFGVVHLRGSIFGSSGTVAFTLSAGYRPAARLRFPLSLGSGDPGFMHIEATGEATPVCNPALACAGGGTPALDGITFVAGQ